MTKQGGTTHFEACFFVLKPTRLDFEYLIDLAGYYAYRVSGYVMFNLADDAAWLAFMFC